MLLARAQQHSLGMASATIQKLLEAWAYRED